MFRLRHANDIGRKSLMQSTELNIFKHTSYRAFLSEYGEEKKSKHKNWSYGAWARKLNLSATASLTMILNGQRNPGKDITQKFLKYFKFNKKEASYFQDLILLEKVQNDPRLCVLLMEKLERQSPHSNFVKIDDNQLRVISKWYYYALREMIHLENFKEDYDWIAKKLNFKVTASEVKKAIQDLVDLKLLDRNMKGELICSVGAIDTQSDIANEYLKRFHEQMIDHAQSSIRKTDVEYRSINGQTITINTKDLPKAKELISKFQDDLCKLMEANKGDSIYQCNIQFFPLTKVE